MVKVSTKNQKKGPMMEQEIHITLRYNSAINKYSKYIHL